MAITFAYTESTNVVVVTEGTAETPATFADFVTADRAGTGTDLLVAGSPASDLALTYAVRPVEDLAILVKCIVANKTAEADFIFITGKDWRGAAQTESIDVTAGNDSYTSTKYWSEITTLDCSDNAAGGGTVWADGDLSVTQDIWGVIWDYGNGQYQYDSYFTIGDDSTATHFRTDKETITINGNCPTTTNPLVKNNGNLYSGTFTNGLGCDGSVWNFVPTEIIYLFTSWEGAATFYGCRINVKTDYRLYFNNDSDLVVVDTVINFESGTGSNLLLPAGCVLTGVTLAGALANFAIEPQGAIPTVTDLRTNVSEIRSWVNATVNLTDLTLTNTGTQKLRLGVAQTMNIIDCVPLAPTLVTIDHADGVINQKVTVNIHVSDKDGNNLSGVAVLCEDTDGNTTGGFTSVNTDANGDIAEQTIIYKQWTTTSETLKTYSPHKFTLSKAGYETLVLDSITMDEPIEWHLELQPVLAKDYEGNLYRKLSPTQLLKVA